MSVEQQTSIHPFDPLTVGEAEATVEVVRASGEFDGSLFLELAVVEPSKAWIRQWSPGTVFDRHVKVMLSEPARNVVHEVVVNLATAGIESQTTIDDVLPGLSVVDGMSAQGLVVSHPDWQDAMRKRGIDDFATAVIEPHPSGFYGPQQNTPERGRFVRCYTYVQHGPTDNPFAHPIDNLVVIVNLDTHEVVEVLDFAPKPVPGHLGSYVPEALEDPRNWPAPKSTRSEVRPLDVVQPEGPSFELDGHHLRWQKWDLRVGFTQREGLVLHQVGYEDEGGVRPILHRASLAELFVPYSDPAPNFLHRGVFDEGEIWLGRMAASLTNGCDCLGEIRYLDAVVMLDDGTPLPIENAICIHEEDAGIAWRHHNIYNEMTGRPTTCEVRRMRRLVISFVADTGNYCYRFAWHLYQDGAIECEVGLTGIVATGAVEDGEVRRFGVEVAPNLYAPNHKHIFCFRLDVEVDGPHNSVLEVDSEPAPFGAENPYGSVWEPRATLLETEGSAMRDVAPERARFWKVVNNASRNSLGQPVAYVLYPAENSPLMHRPGSWARERALFATHNLWVTRFDASELYAAGDYPFGSPGNPGLPQYAARDRSIVDEDIVLWYVAGAHHIPRPEDWPVMPMKRLGFRLEPNGFFNGNPSLDLPRSPSCHADRVDGEARA